MQSKECIFENAFLFFRMYSQNKESKHKLNFGLELSGRQSKQKKIKRNKSINIVTMNGWLLLADSIQEKSKIC